MVPDQETSKDEDANFDISIHTILFNNLLKKELAQKCINKSQNFLLSQTGKTQRVPFKIAFYLNFNC
jgi:hypothetical protein